jgi:hypothetical protein
MGKANANIGERPRALLKKWSAALAFFLPPNAEHYLAGGSVCFLARHKTSQLARWQCDKASLDLADKSFKPVTTPSRFKRLVYVLDIERERRAARSGGKERHANWVAHLSAHSICQIYQLPAPPVCVSKAQYLHFAWKCTEKRRSKLNKKCVS